MKNSSDTIGAVQSGLIWLRIGRSGNSCQLYKIGEFLYEPRNYEFSRRFIYVELLGVKKQCCELNYQGLETQTVRNCTVCVRLHFDVVGVHQIQSCGCISCLLAPVPEMVPLLGWGWGVVFVRSAGSSRNKTFLHTELWSHDQRIGWGLQAGLKAGMVTYVVCSGKTVLPWQFMSPPCSHIV